MAWHILWRFITEINRTSKRERRKVWRLWHWHRNGQVWCPAPPVWLTHTVRVERPPREQQGLHCGSGATHSHHTPNSGSSCPIFTHPTLTMRGTKADSRKYGKVPEILLLSGHLSVFIEPVWTWDSLLKLLHACPPACSQQITNLLAETNWPGQYVRRYFYRGAAGRVCVFCMCELSKTCQRWGRKQGALS